MKLNKRIITNWALALTVSALVLAHGGFEHVMGTVVKVEGAVLTVKTDKAEVPVKMDAKTVITKGTDKAAMEDLAPGLRVIVDLPEGEKNPVAVSVKIGVAEAAAPAAKDVHEHK